MNARRLASSALTLVSLLALPASAQQSENLFPPMTQYCFPGIGAVIPCPCGQPPNPAGGCANFGVGATTGATLDATGAASVIFDSVLLTSGNHRIPPPAGILNVFWTGTANTTPGSPNGAGVRCVGGNLKRLYSGQAIGGTVSRPAMGDLTITGRCIVLGVPISAGETRFYYNTYRDVNADVPCGSTAIRFNTTNAGGITWGP